MSTVGSLDSCQQRMESDIVQPSATNSKRSHVGPSITNRQDIYAESLRDPAGFWSQQAEKGFYWKRLWPADKPVLEYNFHRSKGKIFIKWFDGALTNICYNALDRHIPQHRDRVCYHWVGDEVGESRDVTYGDMYSEVLALAAVLRHRYHVQKGDVVTLYLPMIPFAAQAMLAVARIGAVSNVVFAGFSSGALAERIMDSRSKLVITADGLRRGSKPILLKKNTNDALARCEENGHVVKCLVYERHQRENIVMREGRDSWYADVLSTLTDAERADCPIEWIGAEDPLFLLYTSGSTGKPKAILHTLGGYMVYAGVTFKYSFDYHEGDVYFCTADIGWVTGHSYGVYGPMINAATSVLFEGMPTYPTPSRWWEIVDKYGVTIFYTAPTAIRALMQHGEEWLKTTSRSTLRVLGSVGEPINVSAWKWYHAYVGNGHADVVDTWWQTETGGHLLTPFPGCTPLKAGSATLPFLGVAQPGDGARRDADGYYWVTGRVDDVLNVSGHRIGTREVEEVVNALPEVVESAVVGVPHTIKGECIYVFVTFNNDAIEGNTVSSELLKAVREAVRAVIGPFATPDHVQSAQCGLPKTRSGKIVRRLLRKIAAGVYDDLGDVTTLLDKSVVDKLIEERESLFKKN
uniref:acetate--CoA ligase n=1 Tax=Trypanosoma vivax (strain Y486) TaxID=1055687 RepID=G0U0J0_TRYVY|nr:putative acetyl-CoA synthetase, fragment [Trypanosoma vivax Y486]